MVYSGLIAKYNLEDWYEKTFTSKEKEIIESYFPSIFIKNSYEPQFTVATELLLIVRIVSTERRWWFSDIHGWSLPTEEKIISNIKRDKNMVFLNDTRKEIQISEKICYEKLVNKIYINETSSSREKIFEILKTIRKKIIEKAYSLENVILDDYELFIYRQFLLEVCNYDYPPYDTKLELCKKQIELSDFVAKRLKSDNKKMPINYAYDFFYSFNQDKNNWKACLSMCKKAQEEGWASPWNPWEKKIDNCERKIIESKQRAEQEKLAHAKENDAIKNHDIKTLFTLAEQDNNIYKIIVQNFDINEWTDEFKTIVKNDDSLLDKYCKKIYQDIISKNPSLFIHMALGSLKYPKSMKSWIEFLYFTDESGACSILDIENSIDNIKSYKCYVGIIINSEEKIFDYLEKVKQFFPENEIKIHSKNPREVLIKVKSKDIVFKEKLNNPWCHYYAEFARYLNGIGYDIGLSEIMMNCLANDTQDFGQFDFVKISNEFQNNFDTLISMTDKSYFTQKLLTYDTSFIKPAKYTKVDIKQYLMENADRLLTNSWHTLVCNFSSNGSLCFYENLPNECDFYIFDSFDFITLNKDFSNEYRIKNIISDKNEKQGIIYITLKLKNNSSINDYLQSATTLFQNHDVFYDSESFTIYISIEKDDLNIQPLTSELIDSMIDNSADIIEDMKKINAKAKYKDEYIDLKCCSEYIFSGALNYLISSFKKKYYMKLKEFIELINEDDFIKEVNLNIHEIYYKIDFNTDTNFLAYVSMLRDNFIKNFYPICQKYGKYFFIALWEKDFWHIESYLSEPFDTIEEPYKKINLLYNLNSIKEDFGGEDDISFIPELDTFIKRDDYPKYQWVFKFGINLDYLHFEEIQTVSDKIFTNNLVNIKRQAGIAIVEIHLEFSDFDLIDDEKVLENSFLKHLGFIKLAYCTNIQCKEKDNPEYISDDILLSTIAYNESKYLFKVKKDFCNKLEQFFYTIGREKFVEHYKNIRGCSEKRF